MRTITILLFLQTITIIGYCQSTLLIGVSEQYQSIQTAIDNAQNGDTIKIVDSVITEGGIVVDKDLVIIGKDEYKSIVQAAESISNSTDRVLVVNSNCNVKFESLRIRNGKKDYGGGIRNYGNLCLDNILLDSNWNLSLSFSYNGAGGAIHNSGNLTILNSQIYNNNGNDGKSFSDILISNCSLCDGASLAAGAGGKGGAIYNSSGKLTISNSLIFNNSVGQGGVSGECYIIEQEDTVLCFENNFVGNDGKGGAIYLEDGELYISNCIFTNNKGPEYSCIYSSGLNDTIINSVFWNNNDPGLSQNINLFNCLVEGGWSLGQYNFDADPKFINTTDSIGIMSDIGEYNWRILPESPCINRGTVDTTGLGIPVTDFGGNERVQFCRIDIGPYEYDFDREHVICEGESIEIGYPASPNFSYSWSSIPLGFSSSNALETASPDENISYILASTDNLTSCISYDTITVEVYPFSTLSLDLTNDTTVQCSGVVQLSATPSGAQDYIYTWSTEGSISSTTIPNPTATINATTTYYVTVEDINGCGSITDSVKIWVVNDYFNANITSSTGSSYLCEGMFLNAGSGYTSYEWSDGTNSQYFEPDEPGTFYCTVTNSEGCWGSGAFTVESMGEITCDGSTVMCSGDTRELDAGAGMDSYEWNTGAPTQTITAQTSGLYECTVMSGGCMTTFQILLTDHPGAVEANFSSQQNGANVEFTNLTQDVSVAHWEFGDGHTSDEISPSHIYEAVANYDVCLSVFDQCGAQDTICKSVFVSIASIDELSKSGIKIYPNPTSEYILLETNLNSRLNVKVFDLLGKEQIIEVNNITEQRYQIDLQQIPPGSYLLKIETGEKVITEQIIKY